MCPAKGCSGLPRAAKSLRSPWVREVSKGTVALYTLQVCSDLPPQSQPSPTSPADVVFPSDDMGCGQQQWGLSYLTRLSMYDIRLPEKLVQRKRLSRTIEGESESWQGLGRGFLVGRDRQGLKGQRGPPDHDLKRPQPMGAKELFFSAGWVTQTPKSRWAR